MDNILYYDPSKRPLQDKIDSAIKIYQNKYHQVPTVCLVYVSDADKDKLADLQLPVGVKVVPHIVMTKNHFLVG